MPAAMMPHLTAAEADFIGFAGIERVCLPPRRLYLQKGGAGIMFRNIELRRNDLASPPSACLTDDLPKKLE